MLIADALEPVATGLGKPLKKEEIEANPHIQADSRVLAVLPFVDKTVNAFGLQLRFADASELLVIPTADEPDDAKDNSLPNWLTGSSLRPEAC